MAEFEKATVETLHWNWEQSPVMVVQIFTGDNSAGHWSLLIIDRSSYKPGIFVYFDSLGGGKHTMQEVKNVFTRFPFCRRTSKWIHACVPKQGSRTNDCGVYMTCLATAFVKSILERDSAVGGSNQRLPYTSVTVELNGVGADAYAFGIEGRRHLMRSMTDMRIDLDSEVFNMINITCHTQGSVDV